MKKLLLLLFALSACKTRVSSVNQPFPAFDTEAHRGGRGLMPENTIPAMLNAIDLGVTTLEMDIHITGDGKVIISHDDYVNPLFSLTADGKEIPKSEAANYAFYKMNFADIAKFDVGSRFYDKFPQQKKMKVSMPLLSDLVEQVQAYIHKTGKKQPFYNIETKSSEKEDNINNPVPDRFVKLLMDVVEEKKIAPWVVVQSFDKRTLQVLRKKYPHMRASYLVENNKKTFAENIAELGFIPFVYSPAYKLVTAEMVKEAHAKGIKVVPWTVNTTEEIDALKALGVDGIISDYPNLL
ncbi:glycerophosphodiester phosphodiesterase family protein [Hufsiella ginkgonis]|uniref:Glycerophosphodiester phosphodiesterase n=1 Tax=Hufsiella ginkgonis TaxID=2695274 RepID=A0A7K1Y349_9SPHI|nr:glycerophosphodiester phosphodiesterase [Hufsiella ginkgonis]